MIIGIGGVSRAGKTTLAFKIREWLGKADVYILHQDKYIQEESQMPRIKGQIDWEHPDSLDFDRLKNLMIEKSKEFDVVIIEGLMVFNNPEILNLLDKKIYIKISKEAFLSRKTLDNRWGREPKWYIEHIWESHFKYGLIDKNAQDTLHIDGESLYIDENVQKFLEIPKTSDNDN